MNPRSPTITVFEHQLLKVGDQPNGALFHQAHWESLVQLHPKLPLPYYTLAHRGIKFSHYVGVLQTPSLVLEILPKADAHPTPSPLLWRHRLIDMVAECRSLKVRPEREKIRTFGAGTLLDVLILDFLAEVEILYRRGLAKQYCSVEENARSMRGRLLFAQHVRHNSVRQERFYVKRQAYTTQHILHQIIKRALQVVARVSFHPLVQQRSRRLLSYFTDVNDVLDRTSINTPLVYNRQTVAYRTAVEIAQQIIAANFSHVYRGTTHQGFAMLFDMNLIFEEFIYRRLRRLTRAQGCAVHRQTSRSLWGGTKVRPDIIVELPDSRGRLIIDTKWKVLTRPQPSASDLHQLYVYNQLFQAQRGILLYPDVHHLSIRHRRFEGPGDSYAEVNFVTLADDQQTRIGKQLDESLLRLLSNH